MYNSKNITYVSTESGYTTPEQVIEWIRNGGRDRLFIGDVNYSTSIAIDELLGDRDDITIMSTTLSSKDKFKNVFGIVQSDLQVARYYQSLNPMRVQVVTDNADGVTLGDSLREVMGDDKVTILDYRLRIIHEPLDENAMIIVLLNHEIPIEIPDNVIVYQDYRSQNIQHPNTRIVVPSPRDWNWDVLDLQVLSDVAEKLQYWDPTLNVSQIEQYEQILGQSDIDNELQRLAFDLVTRAHYPSISLKYLEDLWKYVYSNDEPIKSPESTVLQSMVTLNDPDVRRILIEQLRDITGSIETDFYDNPISIELGHQDITESHISSRGVDYTIYTGLIPDLIEICHVDETGTVKCQIIDYRSLTSFGYSDISMNSQGSQETLEILEIGEDVFVDRGDHVTVNSKKLTRSIPNDRLIHLGLTPLTYTILQYVDEDTRKRLIEEWGLEGRELYLNYVTIDELIFRDIEVFAGLVGQLNRNLKRNDLVTLWNQYLTASKYPKYFFSRRYIDRTTGLPRFTTYDILDSTNLITEDPQMFYDQNYGQIYGPNETLQRFSVSEFGNILIEPTLISAPSQGILRYDSSFSLIGIDKKILVSGYQTPFYQS